MGLRDDVSLFDGHRVFEFDVHIADEDVRTVVVEDEVVGAVDALSAQDLLHEFVRQFDARAVSQKLRSLRVPLYFL